MSVNIDKVKIIFGLKIRQLRLDRSLSLSELSEKSKLSISYLNEIEKGKKYPKTEKIMALSEALAVDYDDLVSLKVNKRLEPIAELLNSKILSQLPLEVFGIVPTDFIELMSEAPAQVSALITAITEISLNHNINLEQFYLSALRSYQEAHDNYFPDLEEAAQAFRKLFDITNTTSPNEKLLKNILLNTYQYVIEEFTVEQYPDLATIRSIFNKKSNKLLINKELSSEQKAFIYGRELGYQYLKITNRPYVSSVLEIASFEQLLNNFEASYFAGAILINRNILIDRLTYFFASPKWDDSMLLSIKRLFHVTPEVFMQRITNVMASHFQINNFFFIRFDQTMGAEQFHVAKEMHLAKLHTPHGTALHEYYCRRWLSLTIIKDLEKRLAKKEFLLEEILCKAQVSEYIDTKNTYLMVGMAKASLFKKKTMSSVAIGFVIDDNLRAMISFLNDATLSHKKVNQTCERCGEMDCQERVKPPTILEKLKAKDRIKDFVIRFS
jgi:XRE family transcriptional regulator, fatty acid utilization regulator